jgi:hypothetical protein
MLDPTRFMVFLLALGVPSWAGAGRAADFSLAPFSADITVPAGHRLMGILPTKAKEVVDPLLANGFVLTGGEKPVVVLALDWCEVRNGAYDKWREAVAEAAGTTRERVFLSSLHQHDAPVTDSGAQRWLNENGLAKELFDESFQEECIRRVAAALRESLAHPRRVTHVGTGQARVEHVASNRRVVHPDGTVSFNRGSSSGSDPFMRDAPEGEIDPFLKTLSFWDGDRPVAALHAYATHPMSAYGDGGVSADFVGMARRLRFQDDPGVFQVYVSGASGDVTAGKYNDRSPAMRAVLAQRLHDAMKKAWSATTKTPLARAEFRHSAMSLPFREGDAYSRKQLTATLTDSASPVRERILAAMALSSLDRVERGQAIDLVALDLGSAHVVLLPGESFVGYQLTAQALRPDSFVLAIGYGECWPGYIPTDRALSDGFTDVWLWVGEGCQERMEKGLREVLLAR